MTMNLKQWTLALGLMTGGAVLPVFAQDAKPAQAADYIVAVVDSDPITASDLRTAVQRITRDAQAQRQTLPPADELNKRVLERLINERAQLHVAAEKGIRIDDATLDAAEQGIARQNQISVAELRARVTKDGLSPARFRRQLRDQLMLQRLHEREVEARMRITDVDVDRYLAEQQSADNDPGAQEVNLAHLLVSVSEKASPDQVAQSQKLAEQLLKRARAGEDFAALVQEASSADRSNGGQMGLRRADRYPPLFMQATASLKTGDVSDVVRSGAGFHLLKVLERKAPAPNVPSVTQSHARHILLRPSAQLTQAAAVERLNDMRTRILAGKATFEALAKEFSQDGSAAQGGDLGWAPPGMFVPEFEEPMNRLSEGQISMPVVSRFGAHLIQLLERRRVELTVAEQREAARARLKEVRYDETFAEWAKEVRGNAFVELREPPQ